jgi:hypothetical protein
MLATGFWAALASSSVDCAYSKPAGEASAARTASAAVVDLHFHRVCSFTLSPFGLSRHVEGRSAALRSDRLSRTLDPLHPLGAGDALETDFGRATRELEGTENAAVGIRLQVCIERCIGFPTIDEDDGSFRVLLLVDVIAGAPRLGEHGPSNGAQDVQDLEAVAGQGEHPEGADDHGDVQ